MWGPKLLLRSCLWQWRKNMQTHSWRCCRELPWKSLWVFAECLVIKLIIISGRCGTSCEHLPKHLIPRTHASTHLYGKEGEAAWLVSALRARINRCCCICDIILVFNAVGRSHKKWYIYNPAFSLWQLISMLILSSISCTLCRHSTWWRTTLFS